MLSILRPVATVPFQPTSRKRLLVWAGTRPVHLFPSNTTVRWNLCLITLTSLLMSRSIFRYWALKERHSDCKIVPLLQAGVSARDGYALRRRSPDHRATEFAGKWPVATHERLLRVGAGPAADLVSKSGSEELEKVRMGTTNVGGQNDYDRRTGADHCVLPDKHRVED